MFGNVVRSPKIRAAMPTIPEFGSGKPKVLHSPQNPRTPVAENPTAANASNVEQLSSEPVGHSNQVLEGLDDRPSTVKSSDVSTQDMEHIVSQTGFTPVKDIPPGGLGSPLAASEAKGSPQSTDSNDGLEDRMEEVVEGQKLYDVLLSLDLPPGRINECLSLLEKIEPMWPSDYKLLNTSIRDKEVIWVGEKKVIPIFFFPRAPLGLLDLHESRTLVEMIEELANQKKDFLDNCKKARRLVKDSNRDDTPFLEALETQIWISLKVLSTSITTLNYHIEKISTFLRLQEVVKNMILTVNVVIQINKEKQAHYANYKNRTHFVDTNRGRHGNLRNGFNSIREHLHTIKQFVEAVQNQIKVAQVTAEESKRLMDILHKQMSIRADHGESLPASSTFFKNLARQEIKDCSVFYKRQLGDLRFSYTRSKEEDLFKHIDEVIDNQANRRSSAALYSHPIKKYFSQNRDSIQITLSNAESVLKSCRLNMAELMNEPWIENLNRELVDLKEAAEDVVKKQIDVADFIEFDEGEDEGQVRDFVEQVVRNVALERDDSRFPENYRTLAIDDKICTECKSPLTNLSATEGICENCSNALVFTDCCKIVPINTDDLNIDVEEIRPKDKLEFLVLN